MSVSVPSWAAAPHTDADLMIFTTPEGVCLDVSPTVEWMLGLTPDQLVGRPLLTVVTAHDVPTIQAMLDRVRRDGSARTTMRLHHRNGVQIWLDISAKQLDDGEERVVLVAGRDVTDDVVALQHLAESEQRWRLAFEHSPIGAALVSADGDIVLANASLGAMLGRRVDALVMMSLKDVTHPDDVALDASKMTDLLAGVIETYTVEKRFVTADGTLMWGQLTAAAVPDLHGDVRGLIVQLQDVTQRRDAELELANRALHDPLTGLANRFLVQQWLGSALLEHLGRDVGVLYCDLDRFKVVNDSLGHTAGDEVLVEAAARLCAAVRPEDLVGRVGGDEFVVVCERLGAPEDLTRLAARLCEVLDEPIVIGEHSHTVTISIGAALGRSPDNADDLLMRADMALLRAKRLGRARVESFDATIDRIATRDDLELEEQLRASIGTGQLRAFYQPILTLADRQIVGHEALLRWEHPQKGLLAPARFLDIAENTGLIRSMGWWVLGQACRDAAVELGGVGGRAGWVAVNASPTQLTRSDVYDVVMETLERTQLPPQQLHLEITETALMQASPSLVGELRMLREAGVGVVLDDFGTGFSSLSLLRDFPVSMVKVDKSFIDPLLDDSGALAIVRAVLGMCGDIGIPVVAEGVETEAQAERLAELGCSHVQGYLFGRPRSVAVHPSDAFETILSRLYPHGVPSGVGQVDG
jgi:diguanylate cyclase (GGDEF)-like protein/PAS domain S-box-containing protein